MTAFDDVTSTWGSLRYMKKKRAAFLRDLIVQHDFSDLLELGFYHGKSSAYMAAILEDLGRGHLTTIDLEIAKDNEPSIDEVLDAVGLAERVTPIYSHRSYLWELGQMVAQQPRPSFDFCYLDGGHTWDVTGFGFVLVDMLLEPGGIVLFDDLDWTISGSAHAQTEAGRELYAGYSQDEKDAKGVRMAFELLGERLGYELQEVPEFHWGVARKPAPRRRGLFRASRTS